MSRTSAEASADWRLPMPTKSRGRGQPVRFVWIGAGYLPDADPHYSCYLADQIERADLEDTVTIVDAVPDLEPVTLSEVGTKLDLARAYVDMGDPDGARNILNEVLSEGSASQKQEAQRLIESLPG